MATDYRSAKTGKYVTKAYANSHKATTVSERNGNLPRGGTGNSGKGKGGK